MKASVYITGPEIGIDPEVSGFYNKLYSKVQELGYLPYSSIRTSKALSGRKMVEEQIEAIEKSKYVIAYIGKSSLEAGFALGVASQFGIQAVLVYEDYIETLPKFCSGLGVTMHIKFDNFNDAVIKVVSLLVARKKMNELERASKNIAQ